MTGQTLGDALDAAQAYWGQGKGGRVQFARASRGVALMGGPNVSLDAASKGGMGTALLTALRDDGYSPESIGAYYATTRTMLRLSGVGTEKWPRPPKKPRVASREPITDTDLDRLVAWLQGSQYPQTADLANLLKGTGLRIDIEALSRTALEYDPQVGEGYGVLRVTGKGGHERTIPVVDPEARAILGDPERLEAVRRVNYKTHLQRWKRGLKACGITTRLPTPHAARHAYCTRAYKKSGGNIRVAQELMGHSSPQTTARYIGVDLGDMAGAL